MNLVIVESPAKAKTINKYLGDNYTVLASYGHIRDLPSKNGSVDPDQNFKMEWEVDSFSKKYLKEITDAAKDSSKIIRLKKRKNCFFNRIIFEESFAASVIQLKDGRLVSASWDNTLKVWDLTKPEGPSATTSCPGELRGPPTISTSKLLFSFTGPFTV